MEQGRTTIGSPRTADVWWRPWRGSHSRGALVVYVDLRPDPALEKRARELLDDDERARWRRFRREGPRRRFALGRAALRVNLCARLGCSNRELSFGRGEHGKPFARVSGTRVDAHFNVSHSAGHGLIGFTKRGDVGVDVEVRAPGRDCDAIGARIFTERERMALSEAAGSAKDDLFYRLWTLKEALIKALGTGFALSPARFETPRAILDGGRRAEFRFPHLPGDRYWLEDLGGPRFAAASARKMVV